MLFLDMHWLSSSLFISLVLVTFCSFMTGMTGWSHSGCEHFYLFEDSPFEIKCLLAILSSKVELYREHDGTVCSGGNSRAILLPLKMCVVRETTSVQ